MKVDSRPVGVTATAAGMGHEATGLMAGTHNVYVEVADMFGNVASESWSFRVEQTPPTISSVEPDGEVNTATPALSASYTDGGTGIDVNSVVLMLNGAVVPAIKTGTSASYRVTVPLQLGVEYTVKVVVADKAGNSNESSSNFTLEDDAPEISNTKPSGTVSEEDAAGKLVISADLEDDGSGVDADSVKMWLDGKLVDASATTEHVQYTVSGLSYGQHKVRLVVADVLGNVADKVWDFSVDDSTPPTVTVVSPKQDAVVGTMPVIRISYSDTGSGVDLTSVDVKVDDNPVMATTMAPAGAKVVSAGEASYEVKLDYGSHTLTVVVADVAGNKSEPVTVEFIVEGDVLKLIKPHNYPNPVTGGTTTITFGLSQAADVTIAIYDFTATLVATVLEDEPMPAGTVEKDWNGTTDAGGDRLANGVYFCKVLVKTDSETKHKIVKIAIVKGD
jgi:hypothetical protein